MIWVNATGYLYWESVNTDVFRGAILASNENAGGTAFYAHLCLATDYGCADDSEQYTPLVMSRVFSVSTGGTYTYRILADNPWSTSRTSVYDICMTAMYFPTGGAGAAKAVMPLETPAVVPNRDSIDGR